MNLQSLTTKEEKKEAAEEDSTKSKIVQRPQIPASQFTALDDFLIYVLDTLSPFDIKFISDHVRKKDEKSIKERLNHSEYWKNTVAFKRLPLFVFETIFIRDGNWASRTLLLLTAKRLIPLHCKQATCIHEFAIPQARLMYSEHSSYGINPEDLCKFINDNVKKEYLPALRKTVPSLEDFMDAAKINFRDLNQNNGKSVVKTPVLPVKRESSHRPKPFYINERGVIMMEPEHQQTLKNIVKAIGKNRWEDATQLLLATHDHVVDFDAEDVEIYKRIAGYYQRHLDPDKSFGDFSTDEDKCIIFLWKIWNKAMQEGPLWNHIARHMKGRNAPQIKNRFLRVSENSKALTLENIKKYAHDFSRPATFNHDKGLVFSLTIFPKNTTGIDITSKLQREARFLVAGTPEEMFILPCKYSALRCTHMGMEQNKFTYDPTRPDEQFLTFLKLTFTNALKKAELVDNKSFHFTQLKYNGDGIHQIMEQIENERFVKSTVHI